MRVLNVVLTCLAFCSWAEAKNEPGWRLGGKYVCQWPEAKRPLIPEDVYITADQQEHLKGVFRGITKDIKRIGNRVHRGRLQGHWRRTRKHWDMATNCISTPHFFDVQNYLNGVDGIHESMSLLHTMTKRTKEREAVEQAMYDLADKQLRLLGLINDLYGDKELPRHLIERPWRMIRNIMLELEIDVREKTLHWKPADPDKHETHREPNNRIDNRKHPTSRD